MKIGIDARLWAQTGIGRYIRNLVREIQELDEVNEYVLFVRGEDLGEVKETVKSKNIVMIPINIPWHSIKEQIYFPIILRKNNLDLVHFPYFSLPIFYNRRYVITIHDLIINHIFTGKASNLPLPIYLLKREVYKFVVRKAAIKSIKIIAVSKATKSEIIDHIGVSSKKIQVIYEGSDPAIKTGNGNAYKFPYLLYVGNAYPHKNLNTLLKAFKKIQNENSKLKLIMVGKTDSFYEDLKEKIKSENLEKNVLMMDRVSDEELAGLYKSAQALVIPSLMEGFGLPVLEAMNEECLVICSDISSFRELAGDAAIYFNPYVPDDMAAKIKNGLALSGAEKEKYTLRGKKIASTFSWKKMARQTIGIYESSISLR